VEVDASEMRSAVVVRYMRRPEGDYMGNWTTSPTGDVATLAGQSLPALVAGQTTSATEEILADMVCQPEVAQWVSGWRLAVLGQPSTPVEIETKYGQDREPGEVVIYEEKPYLIRQIRRVGPLYTLTLAWLRRW
jgi:hypothetical protein